MSTIKNPDFKLRKQQQRTKKTFTSKYAANVLYCYVMDLYRSSNIMTILFNIGKIIFGFEK